MTIHTAPFEGAGKTYQLKSATPGLDGQEFRCEDYWDRVSGMSWTVSEGNPAALKFALRSGLTGLPLDDNVVYGKIGSFGELVHVSELVENPPPVTAADMAAIFTGPVEGVDYDEMPPNRPTSGGTQ